MKNPTPRSLALIAAFVASAIVLLTEFITDSFLSSKWIAWVAAFVITFAGIYFIVVYLLEVFIYRKIKLIYKNISTYKDSKEKTRNRVDLDEDILGNVNKEVLDWQQSRADEIAELKKLETFRKEFLGNVSHELKTPIFNIQGYIHTLLDGAIEDKEVNTYYLQRAVQSAERLALIVEDLEAISKLESGELILDLRTFDIYELVKDVYESCEMKAKEKNNKL